MASGELRLQCLSIPIDPTVGRQRANPFADTSDPSKDLWLVIQVGENFELPILPTQRITLSILSGRGRAGRDHGDRVFSIPFEELDDASADIVVPGPITASDKEDLETFEVLLKQYGSLTESAARKEGIEGQRAVASASSGSLAGLAPGEKKVTEPSTLESGPSTNKSGLRRRTGWNGQESGGRLVLVDDKTGEVVGELDQEINVEDEDEKKLEDDDKSGSKAPVVVDFGTLSQGVPYEVVTVKTIKPEDMDDWILKGAHYFSKGILSLGNNVSDYSTKAAERYCKTTTPAPEPMKFSPAAKASIRGVHNVSATGFRVTRKTLDMVSNAAGTVIQKVADPVVNTLMTDDEKREDKRRLEKIENGHQTPPDQPLYDDKGQPISNSSSGSTTPKLTKHSLFRRAWMAAEVIGTSLEASAQTMIASTSDAATSMAGHKYGAEAAHATRLIGGSARNVTMVFVDVRGVARKTIIKSAKRGVGGSVKARMADGQEITLAPDGAGQVHMATDEAVARQSAAAAAPGYDADVLVPEQETYPAEKTPAATGVTRR